MNLSYLLRLFLPLFLVGAAAPSNSVHSASPFPTPALIQRPTFTYVSGGVTPSIPDAAREAEAGYGFEGGRVVREGGAAYLFTAEFKGWPINANMRIGKLVPCLSSPVAKPQRGHAQGVQREACSASARCILLQHPHWIERDGTRTYSFYSTKPRNESNLPTHPLATARSNAQLYGGRWIRCCLGRGFGSAPSLKAWATGQQSAPGTKRAQQTTWMPARGCVPVSCARARAR